MLLRRLEDVQEVLGEEALTFAGLLVLCVVGSYFVIRHHFSLLPESTVRAAVTDSAALHRCLSAFAPGTSVCDLLGGDASLHTSAAR